MKKITFLIGAALLSLNTTIAQDEQAEKPKSKCTLVFEDAYEKIENNYAGWHEKLSSSKAKKKFAKLTEETRERVRNVNEPAECYFMMNDWLSFFEDGHLFINIPNPYQKPEPEEERAKRAARVGSVKYRNEDQFRKFLDSKSNHHDLVGIWETEDSNYRLGVLNNGKGEFNAFLMEAKDELWTAGKSKFTLSELYDNHFEAEYRYFDFTSETKFARKIKNYLVIEGIYKLKKVYPEPKEEVNNMDILTRLPDYRVEQIDDKTVLITLPPFTMYDSDDVIMSMVTKYSPLISSTENLIVDMRNNPGGNENAFAALYPYIADKPIVRKGGLFRSSEENIVLLGHELQSIQGDPKFKRILAPKLNKVISLMKSKPGEYVQGPDKVFQYVKPTEFPKKVAILVNENTASTAESVTLEAKQSSKTIIMGTRTKGLADYIEVRDWGLPAYGWRLALGMAKSMRGKDIDNKGIKPDVKVPSNEVDWVSFAADYLSKR
ncbi:S41 family peptidase [Jiulongibacter sp. NS-SX5]|uniref:S41 family peptidase n=1 Tax=Jiulongibacter sp. NS-SX5 TaxID=3463854 RepID=UPI0040596B01